MGMCGGRELKKGRGLIKTHRIKRGKTRGWKDQREQIKNACERGKKTTKGTKNKTKKEEGSGQKRIQKYGNGASATRVS